MAPVMTSPQYYFICVQWFAIIYVIIYDIYIYIFAYILICIIKVYVYTYNTHHQLSPVYSAYFTLNPAFLGTACQHLNLATSSVMKRRAWRQKNAMMVGWWVGCWMMVGFAMMVGWWFIYIYSLYMVYNGL